MSVRMKHHAKGYAELLKDAGILADIRSRARAIAEAAGDEFDMRSSEPHTRARAAVVAPRGDPDNKMILNLDAGR